MKRRLAHMFCWVLVCCALSATVAQAQPSELAPPAVPSVMVPTPVQPVVPTAVQPVVPTAGEVALAELHRLQLREPALWKEYDRYCVGCGATAVVLGVPVAVSMLTMGGLFIGFASDYDDYDDGYEDSTNWARRDRGIGVALLLVGLAGAAAAIWGTRKIIRERRPRNAALNELRSIAERRTLVEQILETYVMQPRPAP